MEQTIRTLKHVDVPNRSTVGSEIVARNLIEAGQVLNADECAAIPIEPVDSSSASGCQQGQARDSPSAHIDTGDPLDKGHIEVRLSPDNAMPFASENRCGLRKAPSAAWP